MAQQGDGLGKAAKTAQLAKAAADIVKGASIGGLKGAAVGAAKSFLPQIIKWCLYILVMPMMLSVIFFTALPSSEFGFDGMDDAQIAQMTEESKRVDQLYLGFEDTQKNFIDGLISVLSTGYDDWLISQHVLLLGYNWTAAISSVLHEQDLGLINEDSVSNLAEQTVSYTKTEESYEEIKQVFNEETGEFEDVLVAKKRLKLDIVSLSAEQLMTNLGFTEFQKEWAHFIHDNLEEKQESNEDYPLEDIGDIVFPEGSTQVVYYNQKDVRWGNLPYGTSDTIAQSGCGPTSLAMVVSSLTDTLIDPNQMSQWAYENGYCIPNGGSYHSLIYEGAEHYGLKVNAVGVSDAQEIVDALSAGKLVIAIMGKGTFTSSGHFLVLRGVTAEGKIVIADSFSLNYTNQEWDLSLILNESSKRASNNNPFWIISN